MRKSKKIFALALTLVMLISVVLMVNITANAATLSQTQFDAKLLLVFDTTLVKHSNGKWYYVKNGAVDFTKNGKVYYSGKYYTVKKGVVV